jgi:signal transduction histidine kinase
VAAHAGRFETEGWRVRKDGGLFWAGVVIDAIRDELGRLVGFAKITRDITDRRNAQLEREESQARHAYAQRMDALGQLTGGVAHDFNNLLMIVSGQAQILKRRFAGDPQALAATEGIEAAVRRGASLTRQLVSFSRRQLFNPAVVSNAVGGQVRLTSDVGSEVWPIKVDADEL